MKKEKWALAALAGAGVAALAYKLLSKSDIPEAAIFKPFDKKRFMGLWHEAARLPSMIEKNLKDLTEDYSLNDDGSFKVVTRAYNSKKQEWKEFSGLIKSKVAEDSGRLKVSYLEPVYFAYNVLDVDDDYKYALVSSSNLSYLWILSREKSVPQEIKDRFLRAAEGIGFNTSKLEWQF
ncbi:lipocalin family protein [Mucilaginibacter ginkgonis]|uniref:Lipocalin family protein n=1 Tax=Mucilaginibacter ginkgonis TaxID=2682091 RepID=A0A6I4I1D7_9SPHI|nr:lipocalin family protein [Mucilaginibacter ginkgonis]QQL48936.1 lipocalin family protein [Mucilaginibacter ginkgonis]